MKKINDTSFLAVTDEETVDVVDEKDTALYSVSKKEAHKKGLLHRTVIAELKDSEGKWTLVRQAADKQDPGQWVSPMGGHVMAGETEEDALKREALEELGLVDFKYKLIGKVVYDREVKGRKENHYFILFEIYSDIPVTLNSESVEHKKFTDAELKRALTETPEKYGPPFHLLIIEFYPHLVRRSATSDRK